MRMNMREAEDYLNGIPRFSKKTTKENELRILELLGNPERSQKFVHVAGTNGKGSVCAFTSRILRDQGFSVGTFISPHLVTITERFLIDGEPVKDDIFLEAFHRVLELCENKKEEIVHPSYFEFLFIIGMIIFAEAKVDVTVLEVGLGGRLDATNVIEKPIACVIASISLDHTEILGETIPLIAAEKAGIIKEGCPVIYDDSNTEASEVIRNKAAELSAPAYAVNPGDFEITGRNQTGISFRLNPAPFDGREFSVPFVADYQAMNASLALTAAAVIGGEKIDADKLQASLLKTSWPGRMEPVLPGIFMDGAHNDDGIRVFLETVNKIPCEGKKYLLFSAVVEKDYETMIREICEGADFDGFVITELNSYRALPLKNIQETFAKMTTKPVWSFDGIKEAFDFLRQKKGEKDIAFIAGSLYLAGSIKAVLQAEESRKS